MYNHFFFIFFLAFCVSFTHQQHAIARPAQPDGFSRQQANQSHPSFMSEKGQYAFGESVSGLNCKKPASARARYHCQRYKQLRHQQQRYWKYGN